MTFWFYRRTTYSLHQMLHESVKASMHGKKISKSDEKYPKLAERKDGRKLVDTFEKSFEKDTHTRMDRHASYYFNIHIQ